MLMIALFIAGEDYLRRQASHELCSKSNLGEEYVPQGEKEAIKSVVGTLDPFMSRRMNGTLDDPDPQGRAKRVQHAATWGCVRAHLTVRQDLPDHLQVGLFKEMGTTFDVDIRTAHNSFDPHSDPKASSISLKINISGLASKEPRIFIDDYPEELQQKNKAVQDLIFASFDSMSVSHPSIGVADFKTIHEKQMHGGMPAVLLHLLRRPSMFWATLQDLLKGQKITVPFLAKHNTIHAHRLGKAGTAAKFVLKPCEDNEVKTMPAAPAGEKFFVQRMQADHLKSYGACMDMFAQLQRDSCTTPIEDLTQAWDEEVSPLVPVARLSVPKGTQGDTQSCESLTFNPWYGLAAHQPLGYIGRARREIYKEAAMLRLMKNSDIELPASRASSRNESVCFEGCAVNAA